MDLPLIGEKTVNSFIDFNERKFVRTTEGEDYCFEIDLKEDFNLKEYIQKLKCEEAGLIKYLGTKVPRWLGRKEENN